MGAEEAAAAAAAEASKKEKKKPTNIVIPPKKPKLSKAERRALQEAQRAAKAEGGGSKHKPKREEGIIMAQHPVIKHLEQKINAARPRDLSMEKVKRTTLGHRLLTTKRMTKRSHFSLIYLNQNIQLINTYRQYHQQLTTICTLLYPPLVTCTRHIHCWVVMHDVAPCFKRSHCSSNPTLLLPTHVIFE